MARRLCHCRRRCSGWPKFVRILWIKTELLHPVDKGGRIRTYQMLRSLRRSHHVTYLCLDDGTAAPDALARASEYAQEVVTVPFCPPNKLGAGFFLHLFGNLFSSLPYAIARYRSKSLRSQIERLAGSVDLVICDFLAPSINVPDQLPVPAVLFQHNVEAMIWQRHATVPQNCLRRRYMHEQWQRMVRFEAAECRRYSHVVAVSGTDAVEIQGAYGVTSVTSVGTGVDTEYFEPSVMRRQSGAEIVFVGSMDWMPNDDGIRWFADAVFPLVQRQIASAKLTVVGRNPSQALGQSALRNRAIEVKGSVPDVRPYLESATVSIVPLRIGGGTRLKIYEAMAMGTPIVATTIGAEGLPLKNGEHLLIADSPEAQAAAIVQLLSDPVRAVEMAQNAQRFVRASCGWDAVADQFLTQCTSACGMRPLVK